MTSAEFTAACEAVGWSAAWVAQQCGRSGRVGQDWRSGRSAVPDDVATWLRAAQAWLARNPAPQLPAYRPMPPGRAA